MFVFCSRRRNWTHVLLVTFELTCLHFVRSRLKEHRHSLKTDRVWKGSCQAQLSCIVLHVSQDELSERSVRLVTHFVYSSSLSMSTDRLMRTSCHHNALIRFACLVSSLLLLVKRYQPTRIKTSCLSANNPHSPRIDSLRVLIFLWPTANEHMERRKRRKRETRVHLHVGWLVSSARLFFFVDD